MNLCEVKQLILPLIEKWIESSLSSKQQKREAGEAYGAQIHFIITLFHIAIKIIIIIKRNQLSQTTSHCGTEISVSSPTMINLIRATKKNH